MFFAMQLRQQDKVAEHKRKKRNGEAEDFADCFRNELDWCLAWALVREW